MPFPINRSAVTSSPRTVIQNRRAEITGSAEALYFPSSQRGGYGIALKFRQYEYDLSGSKASIVDDLSGASVFLPLPENLLEPLQIEYEQAELGATGQLFNAGLRAGAQVTGDQRGVVQSSQTASDLGAYVARSLVGGISSEIGGAYNLKFGTAPNPYAVSIFRKVALRTHSMAWKLTPLNEQDSQTIKAIVDRVRMAALPRKNGFFLTAPNEVELQFYGTEYLFGFARAVISNIQVEYSDQGKSFFAGTHAPTSVSLQITFQEIEPLTQESYTGELNTGAPPPSTLPDDPGLLLSNDDDDASNGGDN